MQKAVADAIQAYNSGDYLSAARGFRAITKHVTSNADLFRFLALSEMNLGQIDAAKASIAHAVELNAEDAENHFVSGLVWLRAGDLVSAIDAFEKGVVLQPSHDGAASNLIALLRGQGQLHRAESHAENATKAGCHSVSFRNNKALLLKDLGRLQDALFEFAHLVQEKKHDPELLVNLASVQADLWLLPDAEKNVQKALFLSENFGPALGLMGVICERRGDCVGAKEWARKALGVEPEMPQHYHNLGSAHIGLGEMEQAGEVLAKAYSLPPESARTKFNLALVELWRGNLADGWTLYDARFDAGTAKPARKIECDVWQGQKISGQTLMLWGEQGIGDEICFLHCLSEAIEQSGAQVIVECDPRLQGLIERSFPGVVARPATWTEREGETISPPDYEYHLPTGSLFRIFRSNIDQFPQKTRPIFRVDEALKAKWQDRLSHLPPGLRIGLCWRSGLSGGLRGAAASISIFEDLLQVPHAQWINLQYGEVDEDIRWAKDQLDVTIHQWDDFDVKNDQDSVAAMIENCDLIISDNTAVAHMAGALESECWTVTYDSMWTRFGTSHRPTYVNTKMFMHPVVKSRKQYISDVVAPALRDFLEHDSDWARNG